MIDISFIVPATGETESLTVDAVLEERHRSSALITAHPVEDGGDVTDHVRPDQDTLTMTVFVTNTPIKENVSDNVVGAYSDIDLSSVIKNPPTRESGPTLASAGSSPQRLPLGLLAPGSVPRWEAGTLRNRTQNVDAPSPTVLQYNTEFDRVEFIYNLVHALLFTGTRVRLVTSLRTYENMLFEEQSVPRDAKTGNAIQFEVTMRQVRIVETQTVAAPVDPEEERGNGADNRGGQQSDDAEDEEESRGSLWMRLARGSGMNI